MLSKLKLTLRGPLPGAEGPWDLSALLTVADVNASQPERHLWLVRLLEWLRHAPLPQQQTPTPILRLLCYDNFRIHSGNRTMRANLLGTPQLNEETPD